MKRESTVRRILLRPLVPLYRTVLEVREICFDWGLAPAQRLKYPVISIGNLSTGGSGKTPLAIALAKALIARGMRPDVLSRGYGRASGEPARVKPDGTAEDFGDEPLLIARETGVGVYVAPERFGAGLLAEADVELARPAVASFAFFPIHLLDDGFQHRQLFRNVDILLLNRQDWNDVLLPAGNLREPHRAAHRATVIAIPTDEPEMEDALRKWGWEGPIWRLHRKIEVPEVAGPVLAFCGIARPEQFFHALEAEGLHLVGQLAFPDHYNYPVNILQLKLAEARKAGATALMTTEKDLARLGTRVSIFPDSMPLLTAKLTIEIENAEPAMDWLLDGLVPGSDS